MRLLQWAKDGGPDSPVDGFFVIEIKPLFSIVLLRFNDGSREAFHSHAFNALSWVLKGAMFEHRVKAVMHDASGTHVDEVVNVYPPSLKPKYTSRTNLHRVVSNGKTWVLTLRGPWAKTWQEFIKGEFVTLTNGRKVVG